MLEDLELDLWLGDLAWIRRAEVRKQKTDRNDARRLLQYLEEDRLPRILVTLMGSRDLRHLLKRGHELVTARKGISNLLPVLAINRGVQRKSRLWGDAGTEQLKALELYPRVRRVHVHFTPISASWFNLVERCVAILTETTTSPKQLQLHLGT